ncbi:hypothetical protein QZH41_017660 [Actinostola sp. cb2023]|nr:hypothetical protein QZH41_017660 [Actinostola sp. cb2023]
MNPNLYDLYVTGVGAKTSHDDNWLTHQDDFNDLLAHLNSANNGGTIKENQPKKNDMETTARNSRKRVFYERFIKSKNTSNYSATDMACILGKRSKSVPDSPIEQSEEEDSDGSCASCPELSKVDPSGMTTINSTHSVNEYFAMKMAELKQRRLQEDKSSESTSKENDREKYPENSSSEEEEEQQRICQEKRKKQKKKEKKRKLKEEEDRVEKKRKKKSRKEVANDNIVCNVSPNDDVEGMSHESECLTKKRKKKDKKVRIVECIETDCQTNVDQYSAASKIKKISKITARIDIDENETIQTGERTRKRKKKKDLNEENEKKVEKIQQAMEKNKKKKRKDKKREQK